MIDTKIILLIGRSGRGKSTLANVVTNTNNFKESSGSISETKKIKFEQFKGTDNEINYVIIDTPGIGDTKISNSEVLDIIAEAVYLARNGINQVFFVTNGRFDQYEMATYDLLRTIIFDEDITKHTTIVRTHFDKFRKEKECKADVDLMIKEAKEKRAELEQNISTKEKELADLSSAEVKYQELSTEIEKAKKELTTTNLTEILESCQKRVVYVNNPSLEVEGDELELSRGKRNESRKVLLKHLNEVCQGESYKPEKLKELSEEIAEDYFQYLKKKEELQEELKKINSEKEKTKVDKNKSLKKLSKLLETIIEVSNCCKERKKKENDVIEDEVNATVGIVDETSDAENIVKLENKREKLQREIAEKEKIIHQKVLRHIFNNYEGIKNVQGGDIFINKISGDSAEWEKISQEFTNQEIIRKWLKEGFSLQQVQEWATVLGNDFKPESDAGFCAWLKDKKQLPQNVERWRSEYAVYLGKEIEILDKHNQQLNKEEQSNAQQWLEQNYPKKNRWSIKKIDASNQNLEGYLDLNDFPSLKEINISGNPQLGEVKNKSHEAILIYQNPQEFLNHQNFNKNQVEKIYLRDLDFEQPGELIIDDFPNLKGMMFIGGVKSIKVQISNCPQLNNLNCHTSDISHLEMTNCSRLDRINIHSKLTKLNIQGCPNLRELSCSDNFLTNLDLSQSTKLEKLDISNNNFNQDLSFLSHLVNLKELKLGNGGDKYKENEVRKRIQQNTYNHFAGSLAPLQNLTKLKELNIDNTDLDSGVEYLPASIKEINCSIEIRPESKLKEIKWQLDLLNSKKQKDWEELGFSLEEVKQWIQNGLSVYEYDFADYLKKEKNISSEEIEDSLENLRKEYNPQSWTDVHLGFTPKLQKEWEYKGFTKEQVKEWVGTNKDYHWWNSAILGLKPEDSSLAKYLQEQGITPWEFFHYFDVNKLKEELGKERIDKGVGSKDPKFADYLKTKGYQVSKISVNDLMKLSKEYHNPQVWLDFNYLPEKRKKVTKLELAKGIKGNLIIDGTKGWENLEELVLSENAYRMSSESYYSQFPNLALNNLPKLKTLVINNGGLQNLAINDCPNLQKIDLGFNPLVNLDFIDSLNPEKLTSLSISGSDKTPRKNLSDFSKFKSLEYLSFWDNSVYGSLESLKNLTKLKKLGISLTDIDSGLEYLPDSVEVLNCSDWGRKEKVYGCSKIEKELKGYDTSRWDYFDFRAWKQSQQKWQEVGFSYEQAKDWFNIGLTSQDYNFAHFLKNIKQLTPEKILNQGNLENLKVEFIQYQQNQTQALQLQPTNLPQNNK